MIVRALDFFKKNPWLWPWPNKMELILFAAVLAYLSNFKMASSLHGMILKSLFSTRWKTKPHLCQTNFFFLCFGNQKISFWDVTDFTEYFHINLNILENFSIISTWTTFYFWFTLFSDSNFWTSYNDHFQVYNEFCVSRKWIIN